MFFILINIQERILSSFGKKYSCEERKKEKTNTVVGNIETNEQKHQQYILLCYSFQLSFTLIYRNENHLMEMSPSFNKLLEKFFLFFSLLQKNFSI